MSTTSTIRFTRKHDDEYIPLINIYQHYDGYIDGVGHELAEWLYKKTLVNGLPLNYDQNMANGIGCLAAQFIRDFKEEPGGLYITSLDNTSDEYHYEVVINDSFRNAVPVNAVTEIIVLSYEKEIFRGLPEELLEFNEEEVN